MRVGWGQAKLEPAAGSLVLALPLRVLALLVLFLLVLPLLALVLKLLVELGRRLAQRRQRVESAWRLVRSWAQLLLFGAWG